MRAERIGLTQGRSRVLQNGYRLSEVYDQHGDPGELHDIICVTHFVGASSDQWRIAADQILQHGTTATEYISQTCAQGWSDQLSKIRFFLENRYFITQLGLKMNIFH